MSAAEEIGRLVNRILALAPEAGLYVSIKVQPASELLCQGCGGDMEARYCGACYRANERDTRRAEAPK
jgi:hypothetical protein